MKRLMVSIGLVFLLLSGCGTMTVNIDYGDVTATSTLTESGESKLGWMELTGTMKDSNGTPLVGEGVFCQQVSNYPNGLCAGTRYTDEDGRFSFGPVFLHTADTLVLWALPSSYEQLEITRLGADAWSQPSFDFVFAVPPPQTITQFSAGELGWVTITGSLRDDKGSPLVGESVYCQHVSENQKYVFSNRHTNTRGSFSCDTIFLRDTDRISIQAIAAGFAEQEIMRSGMDLWQNPTFDFVFSQQVTPTPFLDLWSATPTLVMETPTTTSIPFQPSSSTPQPDSLPTSTTTPLPPSS